MTDRKAGSCVPSAVRVALYLSVVMVATACGGTNKKQTTTPKAGAAGGSKGGVIYAEQKGGFGETAVADEPIPAAPEGAGGAAEPEAKPEAKPEPPKPPGNDLTPEQRDAKVRASLRRGAEQLRARNIDGAINEGRIALEADETNVEAMLLLANAYYQKEYNDKSEAILDIALKHDAGKQHAMLWMLLGLVYERTDREDKALASYEKASELKNDYIAAWTNRGAIYLARKRFADATKSFETVVGIQNQSARAHTLLGSAYRGRSADFASDPAQRDDFLKKAEKEFKTAMSQSTNHAPAYFNLGLLYLDADPFPGMADETGKLKRLQYAMKYLNEYRQKMGPNLKPADRVDEYVGVAQKQYEKELKLQESKRKREAAKAKEKASEAPAPTPAAPDGGGGTPAEGGGNE